MFLPSSPDRPEGRPQTPQLALRVALLGTVALVAFGVLIFRLWALQVLASDRFVQAAAQQHLKNVRLPAPRGSILDASGHVLVRNRPGLEVQIDTSALPRSRDRKVVLRRLAPLLGQTPHQMEVAIRDQRRRDPYSPVTVATQVDRNVVFYLKENARLFYGVSVVPAPLRFYPYHRLAAHVFGQLARIGPGRLKLPRYQRRDYNADSVIGYNGVEGAYDSYLRGHDGLLRVGIDASGIATGQAVARPAPVGGSDLRLTIDARDQAAAEQALRRWVVARSAFGADSGAMVAMDPRTGAIRAIASYPSFDPNWFVSEHVKRYRRARRHAEDPRNPLRPMVDRAIGGVYAPGSTFKPFTAVGAGMEDLITPSTPLLCDGAHTYYHHRFANWDHYVNTAMDLPTALARSCDTYFYALGDLFYREAAGRGHPAQRWARRFGFGRDTGIDIAGEVPGLVPTRAFKRATWRRACRSGIVAACQEMSWKPGDSILMAIGQGNLGVTPLQLATAYSILANGGTYVTPHIGQDIETAGHTVVNLDARSARHFVGVRPDLIAGIKQGLEEATHASFGTGAAIFAHFPYDVAGKTGTAQVAGQASDNSWFASYAPANDPKIVVVAVIAKAGHGGDAAAPAVCDFYASYFHTPQSACGASGADSSR